MNMPKITAVKVEATEEERLSMLHMALCNGFNYLPSVGLEADYNEEDYTQAREQLYAKAGKETVCFEDVLIQMLRNGKAITINDCEYDDPEQVGELSLKSLNANWDKMPPKILLAYINEEDDAWTAVDFMQVVAMGEITRG